MHAIGEQSMSASAYGANSTSLLRLPSPFAACPDALQSWRGRRATHHKSSFFLPIPNQRAGRPAGVVVLRHGSFTTSVNRTDDTPVTLETIECGGAFAWQSSSRIIGRMEAAEATVRIQAAWRGCKGRRIAAGERRRRHGEMVARRKLVHKQPQRLRLLGMGATNRIEWMIRKHVFRQRASREWMRR